jgi:hypothetical protein
MYEYFFLFWCNMEGQKSASRCWKAEFLKTQLNGRKKSLYLHTSFHKLFCGNTQKMLYQRNYFTWNLSKETVMALFHPVTIFMIPFLSYETSAGSCSPPKHPRMFHRNNSHVAISVCVTLHSVVYAVNFMAILRICVSLPGHLKCRYVRRRS